MSHAFYGWKTTVELRDLGELDPAWSGIASPLFRKSVVSRYLQRQFLEDAGDYLGRYQATDYWKRLLAEAHRFFTLPETGGNPRILDLGSGGGNSVLPLLDLYPTAEVVASDLSLPLLRALREALAGRTAGDRCRLLQQNAERLVFAAAEVDLVVGGAVLHHLRSPAHALAECARVLRPGGAAVFFEPFLEGSRVVAGIIETLLARDQGRRPPRRLSGPLSPLQGHGAGGERLAPEVRAFLSGLVRDFRLRASMNRFLVRFRRLDDKWLFTRRFFADQARENGFSAPVVYPLRDSPRLFRDHLRSLVRLGLGRDETALPRWALAALDAVDERLTPELRRELLVEGAVILRKP